MKTFKIASLSVIGLCAAMGVAQAQNPPAPNAGRADQSGGGAAETLSTPRPSAAGPAGGTVDPSGGNRMNDMPNRTQPAQTPREEMKGGMNAK